MRRKQLWLFAFGLMMAIFLCPSAAFASDGDFTIEDGILKAYNGTSTTVTIPEGVTEIGGEVFKHEEEGEFSESVAIKAVTIPASVTKIDEEAFRGAPLEEVVFAEGSQLKELGSSSFAYCTKLPSITLPAGLQSIGSKAFDGDSMLASVNIPAAVTTIGDQAFQVNLGLRSVTFEEPSSLESIGYKAFYTCNRLSSITLPEGLKSLGNEVFRSCVGLRTIHLPSTLTSMGDSVAGQFMGTKTGEISLSAAENVEAVDIAEGNPEYQSIDGIVYSADGKTLLYCLSGRSSSVVMPSGVESIAPAAFAHSNAKSVVVQEGVTSIGKYAFSHANIARLSFPGTLKSIPSYSCDSNKALRVLELEEGIESIGSGAFDSCSNLTNVILPASLTNIEDDALASMKGFLVVKNPELSFGDYPIYSSMELTIYAEEGSRAQQFVKNKLTFKPISEFVQAQTISLDPVETELACGEEIRLNATIAPENISDQMLIYDSSDETVAQVSDDGLVTALRPGTAVITASTIDGSRLTASCKVTTTGTSVIDFIVEDGVVTGYRGQGGDVVIPEASGNETITAIADRAFENNRDISSVVIPDTVTTIGNYAFSNCRNLAAVTFGKGLKEIGEEAFSYCTYLGSIELPEGLETMGKSAFASDEALLSATLPGTLKEIPEEAFILCWRLKEINVPQGVETIAYRAYYECEGAETVHLPSSLKTIGVQAFVAIAAEEVTVPEGVEAIERCAFMSCTELDTLKLPASLTKAGDQYFGDLFEEPGIVGADHLMNVHIAAGNKVFSSADGIVYSADKKELLFCPRGRETMTISATVKTIKNHAVYFCHNLKSVVIPDGVETIEDAAFADCRTMTQAYIPASVRTIGKNAFADDEKLAITTDSKTAAIVTYATAAGIPVTVKEPESDASSDSESKPAPASASTPTPVPASAAKVLKKGAIAKQSGQTYKITKSASKAAGTVTFTKAKNAKSVSVPKTVKLSDGRTYKVTAIAAGAFTGKKIRTITIGENVTRIGSKALKGSRATKLVVKTKLLKKSGVKGSLKGSKVKTVQVKVGSRKQNKKYVKAYTRIFTKKIAGKKAAVK